MMMSMRRRLERLCAFSCEFVVVVAVVSQRRRPFHREVRGLLTRFKEEPRAERLVLVPVLVPQY